MSVTIEQRLIVWRFLLALALSVAIVTTLLPEPPRLPLDGIGDKWAHALAFATLALLASLAYPKAPVTRIGGRLSSLGALIEVLQSIPALHRDCDIRDWLADTAGIIAVLALVTLARRART